MLIAQINEINKEWPMLNAQVNKEWQLLQYPYTHLFLAEPAEGVVKLEADDTRTWRVVGTFVVLHSLLHVDDSSVLLNHAVFAWRA